MEMGSGILFIVYYSKTSGISWILVLPLLAVMAYDLLYILLNIYTV